MRGANKARAEETAAAARDEAEAARASDGEGVVQEAPRKHRVVRRRMRGTFDTAEEASWAYDMARGRYRDTGPGPTSPSLRRRVRRSTAAAAVLNHFTSFHHRAHARRAPVARVQVPVAQADAPAPAAPAATPAPPPEAFRFQGAPAPTRFSFRPSSAPAPVPAYPFQISAAPFSFQRVPAPAPAPASAFPFQRAAAPKPNPFFFREAPAPCTCRRPVELSAPPNYVPLEERMLARSTSSNLSSTTESLEASSKRGPLPKKPKLLGVRYPGEYGSLESVIDDNFMDVTSSSSRPDGMPFDLNGPSGHGAGMQ